MRPESNELLTPASLRGYLDALGVEAVADVRELSGGVSNIVLYASSAQGPLVVKQSLAKLNVAEEWLASQERTIREANALAAAAVAIPASVPRLISLDEKRFVLVIEAAPSDWVTWKQQLLEGEVEVDVAAWLGDWLGRWQHLGARDEGSQLADNDAFLQLRVDPYYRVAAARNPDLRPAIDRLAASMLETRRCLVHGDFSPKNILVGRSGRWVIDFEVVHLGDPVFDPAFMLNHLLLKSIHRPRSAAVFKQSAEAFLKSYAAAAPEGLPPVDPYLFGHVGCLMLARVDGKSPAEYLTAEERTLARILAGHLISAPAADLRECWAQRDEVCGEL